jgi:hypothetical protein
MSIKVKIVSILLLWCVNFSMYGMDQQSNKDQNHQLSDFPNDMPTHDKTQKGDGNNLFTIPDTEISASLDKPSVRYLVVKRQSEKEGGAASCGYHALKNVILIARSLRESQQILGSPEGI